MSEQILKALTKLFAIISRQDSGMTETERNFVIGFFEQDLDRKTVQEYVALYDNYVQNGVKDRKKKPEATEAKEETEEERKKREEREERRRKREARRAARAAKKAKEGGGKADAEGDRQTTIRESMQTLKICREINKTLTQKQKIIVLFKVLEMLASDGEFGKKRMEVISTVADAFNIDKTEYAEIESFARGQDSSEVVDSENILIFDESRPPEGSKKRFIDSGLLDGEIIFIHVQSVDMYFTKYTGNDEIFLNGQLVKKNSLLLFSHGSVFKTPKGAPLYYSALVTSFASEEELVPLSFQVKDLEFRFPNGHIGLRNINISEGAGSLIGIMGASGAGKTTLLNTLAGLEAPYKGAVRINGNDLHREKEKLEGVIGYIAQDDLLIEDLTVFENLYYNAKLCFRDLSDEEIRQKVNNILESLGLYERANLKVGSVLNKKISGGQRKRLNIALELIREPAVMFVDEPTSGLSSRDSENVIDLLKELSKKGKLIFVVIHQPSSDIYKMFDKMFLMDTGGYPVFYGHPVEAVSYFKRATNQVGSDEGQCNSCGNVNPELIFNLIEARVVDEYGALTNKRRVTPPEWHDLYEKNIDVTFDKEVKEAPPSNLNIPSKLKQAIIFTKRDFLSKISNTQYMLINLLEAPALAIFLSLVVRYRNQDAHADHYIFKYNDNVPAFILICIIVALFMGLTVSAEEIIRDRKIQKRESFLNLSRFSYLFSKIVILFTLSAVQTLMFVIIGNLVMGIEGMMASYWLVLFSVSCFANVLGLNISATFNSAVTVYIIIPILLIPQMILSGAIFPFHQINEVLTERGRVPLIADIMASRWAYEALTVYQYKDNEFEQFFFDIEMSQNVNSYKVNYWIPKLKEIITRAERHLDTPTDSTRALLAQDLTLLSRELEMLQGELKSKELRSTFAFTELEPVEVDLLLQEANFDKEAARQLKAYLDAVLNVYNEVFVAANERRDSVVYAIEGNPEIGLSVTELENRYHNERLTSAVRNEMMTDKVIEHEGKLIQQSDPIYHVPHPRDIQHSLDYRTHFYAPVKHFMGYYIDTFWFNVLTIWFMAFVLYIALYFELLKKGVDALGELPNLLQRLQRK